MHGQAARRRRALLCFPLGTCWTIAMSATWPGTRALMAQSPSPSSHTPRSPRHASELLLLTPSLCKHQRERPPGQCAFPLAHLSTAGL